MTGDAKVLEIGVARAKPVVGDTEAGGDKPADQGSDGRKSAAAALVSLALERYQLGRTPDGEPFAVPKAGGHVVRMLRGGQASLRAELAKAYRQDTGKVAAAQALADAMLVLEGEAAERSPREVHLRVAEHRGAVWVDLGDTTEQAVKVDAGGWQVVCRGSVPVLFRRTVLTGALPVPRRGGDLADLWRQLNVAETDRPLVLAWLVAALTDPAAPHPVLVLLGEQGTGKSSACRTVVQLVDPSPVPLRKAPKDAEAWITAASGSWVVGLDNVSTVADWLSDTLCRAVTGDGDVRRRLYTDAGLAVFAFRRVVVLNGIDVGALRGDLADRTIMVNLDQISEGERRTEREMSAAWARVWSGVFGALLDEIAGVLRTRPSVRLGSSPRMADFAVIVAALDQLHGTDALAAYENQARTMADDTVTADPFLAEVVRTVKTPQDLTSAKLLDLVTPKDEGWRAPRGWPTSARVVTGVLRRAAPALRKTGWTVTSNQDRHSKVITWRLAPPNEDGSSREEGGSSREGEETEPATPASPATSGDSAGISTAHTRNNTRDTRAHPHRTAEDPQVAGDAGVAGVVSAPSLDVPICRHGHDRRDGPCSMCDDAAWDRHLAEVN